MRTPEGPPPAGTGEGAAWEIADEEFFNAAFRESLQPPWSRRGYVLYSARLRFWCARNRSQRPPIPYAALVYHGGRR
ncbi:MAG: hypothetical protein U1E66_04725 [Rhodospirillales bacterium]